MDENHWIHEKKSPTENYDEQRKPRFFFFFCTTIYICFISVCFDVNVKSNEGFELSLWLIESYPLKVAFDLENICIHV